MRRLPLVTTFVACLLAIGALPAPQARADNYYVDTSFDVVAVRATPATVAVTGMTTRPVVITMTTRTAKGEQDRSGKVMALTEADQIPQPAQMSATLRLVAQKGSTKQWRGVVNVGGPSRVVTFRGAYNCEFECSAFPTPIFGPSIRVQATGSPVLTIDKPPLTDLHSRTYTLSGRVLTTSGRSYGRPVPVYVGRAGVCSNTDASTVVRSAADGRFRATLSNRLADMRFGAPVMHGQCAAVLSDARDIRKRPTILAYAETDIPWATVLLVHGPDTVKLGTTAVMSSAALLRPNSMITLERLHGRTAWRPVSYSTVRPSSRISSYVKGDALGRHTYRIRNDDGRAVSKPFVVETIG